MIVGRPGVGRLVVDVAVLEAGLAVRSEVAVAAGDLVAPDAIGGRADRARLVVGHVFAGCDVIDEGVAGQRARCPNCRRRFAEIAVGDGEFGYSRSG